MKNSKIRELLIADGWEEVIGLNLEEGDYVAFFDEFGSVSEGRVTPSCDSKNPWWQDGRGSIKYDDILLRAPEEWPHLDRRFNANGEEFINVSDKPRKPKYVSASIITPNLLVEDASVVGGASFLASQAVDHRALTKEKPE